MTPITVKFKRQRCQPAAFVAQRHLQSKEAVKRAVEWHKWATLLVGSRQRLTFRFRNFCQIFEGFGFGFGKFGFGKKSLGFGFKKNLVSEKISVSVSENLVSEKKKSI